MKILHLCTSSEGGAATGCRRMHNALVAAGVDSHIWTKKDFNVNIYDMGMKSIFYRFRRKLICISKKYHSDTNPILHSDGLVSSACVDRINNSDFDIVNLHWINDDFLSIYDIAQIKKPLVWTLRDYWAFCGTEHYPNMLENDVRYKKGYNRHTFPKSSSGVDIDKWIWKWKKFLWRKHRFNFVALSSCEREACKSSALFNGCDCAVIPNTLNMEIFKPAKTSDVRAELGIPSNSKMILFGAVSATDPIKGLQFLKPALESLSKTGGVEKLHLVCFGAAAKWLEDFSVPHTFLGSVKKESELAKYYQTADVFVCPSVIESFSNTTLEAISCGTPVVAFNIGGPCDIIQHGENGYLAKPYEPDDLAKGILYCLENHDRLSVNARKYAEEHFSQEIVANKYISFYEEVCRSHQ